MSGVGWGFLGAGWITRDATAAAVHAADGAYLAAVGARDPDRAASLEPARAYPSYEAVLADSGVDIVYVALANDAHRPWVEAALAAGKHVLCEKPLGLTAGEVIAMAAAAERAGRLLVEASWWRWHPRVRLAERLLAAGEIGPVRHVAAGFTFSGVPAGNYRLDPAMGGGAAYDVGCYCVSAATWALGGEAQTVSARATHGPSGIDLTSEIVAEYDAGAADIRASIAEPERQWLIVTGDGGEMELPAPSYTVPNDLPTQVWVSAGRGTRRLDVPPAAAMRLMVEEMSRAVRGEDPGFLVPLADSLAGARVLDAARASIATGAPQPVG